MTPIKSHWIQNRWTAGEGPVLSSTDPATGETTWDGKSATEAEVSSAVAAAQGAFEAWSNISLKDRIDQLHRLEEQYKNRKETLAESICRETGKPRWEALSEVDSMISKIPISIEAYNERCVQPTRNLAGVTGTTRYRPHGVLAVLGPFNFPGHLPNGHIVPALLAGNSVIFKPSEQTPLVGQRMAEAFESAGFAPGVVNVLQGGRETGATLAKIREVNGILFTGSWAGGRALSKSLADHPDKILALEMGGNNPLIVHEADDLAAAAMLITQSAYITAGQRCSCARRLILVRGAQSDALIQRLVEMVSKIRVGFWNDEPAPFMGTVISSKAADEILNAFGNLVEAGGKPLVEMRRSPRSRALLTPGLIDVSKIRNRVDSEIFGPLLQIIQVEDFDAALREANQTAYGLSAGIITDREELYQKFVTNIRAGVTSWNRPLTGASSNLPFGGVGQSGNHRPCGYFAADYVAYPVASLETPHATLPAQLPPGLSL